jgi:hypothetical protein
LLLTAKTLQKVTLHDLRYEIKRAIHFPHIFNRQGGFFDA